MTSEEPLPDRCGAKCRDGGYCTQYPVGGKERCRIHPGTNADGSSHEDNDWAAKHGAYSEKFVQDFLTDQEKSMLEDLQDVLETPEGAQANARLMAGIMQIQARRTGDERFARRYESICDTFGIAPADELEISGDVDVDGEIVVDFEEADT